MRSPLPPPLTRAMLLFLLFAPFAAGPSRAAWLPLDGAPGVAGSAREVWALETYDDGSGTALYAGGSFTVAGALEAGGIARRDGAAWSSIGSLSTGGIVRCMTVWNGRLVIGGNFSSVGGVPAENVAAWDGVSWSALGAGTGPGGVFALAEFGGDLVATGGFTVAGGAAANRIARWDGAGWHALGGGLADGQGRALARFGSNLVVGGSFSDAGGAGAARVARWDGAAWSALGGGLSAMVFALAEFDRDGAGPEPPGLVAGGSVFTQANGPLARWDGATWAAFGGTFQGSGVTVKCLFAAGETLVVGGAFSSVNGASGTSRVAWWSTGAGWAPFGAGLQPGDNSSSLEVLALARSGGWWAGGRFWNDGRIAMHGIACWDGAEWRATDPGIGGNSGAYVHALAPHAGGLAVGGVFASVGDRVNANSVALLTASGWDTLGTGLGVEAEDDLEVSALLSRNDSLYAACSGYTTAFVNRVAVWDGASWTTLGSSSAANAQPYALAFHDGALHVGGAFTAFGGTAANRVARWDGATWHALGQGFNTTVWALCPHGGELVAGGAFTQADGAPASRVARWNGSGWSPMGAGLGGTVRALVEHQGSLYAGCSNGVFRWDGASWLTVGSSGAVEALLSTPSGLVASGAFVAIGGTVAPRIARWNGAAWEALDEGLSDTATGAAASVRALASWDGDLWAGGNSLRAGTAVAPHLARWREGTVDVADGADRTAPGIILAFVARRSAAGGTHLEARLGEAAAADLALFDAAGRRVLRLARGTLDPGLHAWSLPAGEPLASGVYFARLAVTTARGGEARAVRAVLLR